MSTTVPKRSIPQWIVAVLFGILALAFLLRSFFYGYRWLRHVVEGDANFKVLTVWALLYAVVCAAIAWVAFHLPRDDGDDVAESDRARES